MLGTVFSGVAALGVLLAADQALVQTPQRQSFGENLNERLCFYAKPLDLEYTLSANIGAGINSQEELL